MKEFSKGIFYSLTKEGADINTIIGAGIGTALAGLSIHDAIRVSQYSHKDIRDFIKKNPIDAEKFIKKIDKSINPIT